jgi:hypothetical protein
VLFRYGEASSTDATLSRATDLLQNGGANVFVRNYLVCRTFLSGDELSSTKSCPLFAMALWQLSHATMTLREVAGRLCVGSRKDRHGLPRTTTFVEQHIMASGALASTTILLSVSPTHKMCGREPNFYS